MKAQQAPDLAIEIHFASLDACRKQGALPNFEHLSGLTQTIQVYKSSDADSVTHFDFFHSSTVMKIYCSAILNYALRLSVMKANSAVGAVIDRPYSFNV